FHIELPVLQGVPIEALIKFRRDEHESFQRFQNSLRLAINERQKLTPSVRADDIAEQIRLDVIEPELINIRDKLRAAERALAKKSAVGIFMGVLATTCGILAGVIPPASIAAGVGTMITASISAATKHIEENQQISLSNMYFLWKAVKHLGHE